MAAPFSWFYQLFNPTKIRFKCPCRCDDHHAPTVSLYLLEHHNYFQHIFWYPCFWCCVRPKDFLTKIPEIASVFCPKLFFQSFSVQKLKSIKCDFMFSLSRKQKRSDLRWILTSWMKLWRKCKRLKTESTNLAMIKIFFEILYTA